MSSRQFLSSALAPATDRLAIALALRLPGLLLLRPARR
jgi:hypothetical protein